MSNDNVFDAKVRRSTRHTLFHFLVICLYGWTVLAKANYVGPDSSYEPSIDPGKEYLVYIPLIYLFMTGVWYGLKDKYLVNMPYNYAIGFGGFWQFISVPFGGKIKREYWQIIDKQRVVKTWAVIFFLVTLSLTFMALLSYAGKV